jgi:hypothetical protein
MKLWHKLLIAGLGLLVIMLLGVLLLSGNKSETNGMQEISIETQLR